MELLNYVTKQDIIQGYENLKRCIDVYLRENKIKYQVSNSAPSKYIDLIKSYDANGCFIVYNGGDHGLLGKEYNIKFRACHDHGHYVNKLSFSFDDERTLSNIQAKQLALIAWNSLGFTAFECYLIKEIINAEIKGQIDYFEKNNNYVEDQTDFIFNYFNV